MRLIYILTILAFSNYACRQNTKSYLISYADTTSGKELFGYKDPLGKVVIEAEFRYVFTDTLFYMAIVEKNQELVGIDRSGKVILKPFIYDNGPDYIEEDLFRYIENNKIGFANIDGRKIIKAKYDFATPFKDGLSEYTLGGYKKYEEGGEHWWWVGGYDGGFVNHQGQEFTKVTELKNNKREAWTKDKKHFLLNKQGQIITQLE